jgi:hypothetical protein
MELNPPKTRLPGKGESQPAVGEGGRPFEPGRVRDDSVLRARWESANQFCCVPPGDQGHIRLIGHDSQSPSLERCKSS